MRKQYDTERQGQLEFFDNYHIDYSDDLTYDDAIEFLKNEYGQVPGSFFCKSNYKSVNSKIKRGDDGLIIHHIKENEYPNLSNRTFIKAYNAVREKYGIFSKSR